MYRGKNIIAVTPAGRKRYINVLKEYILNNPIIDEWKIWQNTTNPEDIQFLNHIATTSKKITIEKRSGDVGNSLNIHKFFDNCIKPNHVYVRFDDDIVWMDKRSVQNLLDHRIDNPQYFITYGNIINNAICDHLHQRIGALPIQPHIGYSVYDHHGWNNPSTAEDKHRILLGKIHNQELSDYVFSQWILGVYERVSINVISWLGEEFAKFDGKVATDEEEWLSVTKPKQILTPNAICGTALFSHFAFFTQREHMDKTNILHLYEKMVDRIPKENRSSIKTPTNIVYL